MGLIDKPLLIDLSYGRVGSFLGVKKLNGEFPLTIEYTPLSSWKKAIIRDVPEGSLVTVHQFDPRVPYKSIYLLLAGEHGEAPLMQNYLKMKFNDLLKDWNLIQKRVEIQKASLNTQKQMIGRGELEQIQQTMKIQERMQRMQRPQFIPTADKLKILKGGQQEEY